MVPGPAADSARISGESSTMTDFVDLALDTAKASMSPGWWLDPLDNVSYQPNMYFSA